MFKHPMNWVAKSRRPHSSTEMAIGSPTWVSEEDWHMDSGISRHWRPNYPPGFDERVPQRFKEGYRLAARTAPR
jgi:hypothetical protein